MKTRPLLTLLGLGLLIATVGMVGKQRQQLGELRNQAQDLRARAETLTNEPRAEAESPIAAAPQAGPSLELLRLRSQVGQLERRKRELTGVTEENKRLQAQLATKPTGGTGGVPLPAGYIRRAEAKLSGFGTPEDSLQSFLWAIEHRDLPTLMQAFEPEQAKSLAEQVEEQGSEKFFKEPNVIPGLYISQRVQKMTAPLNSPSRSFPTMIRAPRKCASSNSTDSGG